MVQEMYESREQVSEKEKVERLNRWYLGPWCSICGWCGDVGTHFMWKTDHIRGTQESCGMCPGHAHAGLWEIIPQCKPDGLEALVPEFDDRCVMGVWRFMLTTQDGVTFTLDSIQTCNEKKITIDESMAICMHRWLDTPSAKEYI